MRRQLVVSGLLVVGGLLAATLLASSTVGFWVGALAFIGVLVMVAGRRAETPDDRHFVRGPRERMEEYLGRPPRRGG